MSQRVIACQVVGEYVTGDGVVIGAAGSHDEVIIELDFSKAGETWDGTTKTVTFTDALGLNPTNVLLTADRLVTGTTNVYLVPVPNLIKAISGQMGMTVAGVDVEGATEVLRVATELSRFRILPNEMVTWEGDDDVPASAAEQLQAQIDAVLPKFVQLDDSVAAAAASAAASAGSATASEGSAEDAEAWAVGQRGGVDVESTDETYQNNSKYYAGQAAGSASASGASAAASAGSASASAASASASAGSASAAAGSATAAEGSADSAEDWAAAAAGSASAAAESQRSAAGSETGAANSAAAAASSASAAAGSAAAAGTSANNAAGSASASAGSATASAGSAANAAGSAVLSESWAVGHTGARTGEDTNNAKYWSEQAQAAAGGGVSSFNGRSGVVTPQSGDYTARMVGALSEDTPIPSKTSDLTNDSGFITVEDVPDVPVKSVNGKTGNVTLNYSDVGADQAGAAGTVQENLTSHIGDTTKHITAAERTAWNAKQNALTFDSTPTSGSSNPVTSDGIFQALQGVGVELDSIGITRGPEKTMYAPGDTFDPTGMEVTANFLSGGGSISGVRISGYTYQTSALTAGTTSVTISYTAGGVTKTASVPITVLNIGATLNATAWSAIKQVSDMDLGDNFWDVGDTKSITLNGKVGAYTFSSLSVQAFIIGFNHNSAKEGAHRIHFLLGKISSKNVAFCDSKYNNSGSDAAFRMNTSNTNVGGWSSSYMRGTILKSGTNPTSPGSNNMLAALPSDLRAVMKPVTKYTDNTGNKSTTSSAVTATTDYLFLLAEFEVFGVRSYANPYEQNSQEQYAYFATNNAASDRIAYNHTAVFTAVWWWLRSPSSDDSGTFRHVSTDGDSDYDSATYSAGLRAGFAV